MNIFMSYDMSPNRMNAFYVKIWAGPVMLMSTDMYNPSIYNLIVPTSGSLFMQNFIVVPCTTN